MMVDGLMGGEQTRLSWQGYGPFIQAQFVSMTLAGIGARSRPDSDANTAGDGGDLHHAITGGQVGLRAMNFCNPQRRDMDAFIRSSELAIVQCGICHAAGRWSAVDRAALPWTTQAQSVPNPAAPAAAQRIMYDGVESAQAHGKAVLIFHDGIWGCAKFGKRRNAHAHYLRRRYAIAEISINEPDCTDGCRLSGVVEHYATLVVPGQFLPQMQIQQRSAQNGGMRIICRELVGYDLSHLP